MNLRRRLYIVIFEHDTPGGKAFDVALLWAIVASVLAVVLESVQSIRASHGDALRIAEWTFTGLFTLEYLLRLYSSPSPRRYVLSFFGLVDLVALLPSYLSFVLPGAQSLLVVRILRLLRVFRVLKLVQLHGQADTLLTAVRASLPKIVVFIGAVFSVVVIVGAAMYLIEGPEHGFDNIPQGMYWAIVTMTTVGFGDITPETPPGRMLAALLMLMGYGILAVPTGIVSAEMVRATRERPDGAHGYAPLGLDHVNLRTAELERLVSFYVDVVGLTRGARPRFSFGGAWLYLGERPCVHLVEVGGERSSAEERAGALEAARSPVGLEHFALECRGKEAFLARLVSHGVAHREVKLRVPTPSGEREVTQIKLTDPDGNRLHVDFSEG